MSTQRTGVSPGGVIVFGFATAVSGFIVGLIVGLSIGVWL